MKNKINDFILLLKRDQVLKIILEGDRSPIQPFFKTEEEEEVIKDIIKGLDVNKPEDAKIIADPKFLSEDDFLKATGVEITDNSFQYLKSSDYLIYEDTESYYKYVECKNEIIKQKYLKLEELREKDLESESPKLQTQNHIFVYIIYNKESDPDKENAPDFQKCKFKVIDFKERSVEFYKNYDYGIYGYGINNYQIELPKEIFSSLIYEPNLKYRITLDCTTGSVNIECVVKDGKSDKKYPNGKILNKDEDLIIATKLENLKLNGEVETQIDDKDREELYSQERIEQKVEQIDTSSGQTKYTSAQQDILDKYIVKDGKLLKNQDIQIDMHVYESQIIGESALE